ncbi:MAG: phosphate ABC transporter substrate-binding/OmpA family protein [Pseudomonadales bacterium]|nr:phosphate ABC transporter substrate-binding/OmpA family protein [Pseudomonadales bacterium]
MKLHAKLAVLITFIGIMGLIIWRVAEPILTELQQAEVSDVGEKGSIHIAIDGWVGYFPLCSPEMKRRINRKGYGLRCTDDAADYRDRFKKLKSNHYQFVVATVDSYLLNAERYSFPGPIIAVIDESKGGDAIIAKKAKYPNLEALKSGDHLSVVYTPNSPSHHLLKAVSSHFDIPLLNQLNNLIESEGSEHALSLFEQGKADIAVVWEPEVSKALENEDTVRLLGTEDTQQLIVDILIASQKVAKEDPEMVNVLLREYFKTLKFYRDNPDTFVEAISDHYNIRTGTARALLKGVGWATLSENAERWYGISHQSIASEALVETIESAIDILLKRDDFKRNPIPNQDTYVLINSGFIAQLYKDLANVGGFSIPATNDGNGLMFAPLTNAQWESLQEIGSLKARKIAFASGTADLTLEGKQQVDELVEDLKHYPNFRVEVRGHTGLRGDKFANDQLSQARADAVIRYIETSHSIMENRYRAIGYGSSRPLVKKPGESNRAYNYRLPRVEISLVREVY